MRKGAGMIRTFLSCISLLYQAQHSQLDILSNFISLFHSSTYKENVPNEGLTI